MTKYKEMYDFIQKELKKLLDVYKEQLLAHCIFENYFIEFNFIENNERKLYYYDIKNNKMEMSLNGCQNTSKANYCLSKNGYEIVLNSFYNNKGENFFFYLQNGIIYLMIYFVKSKYFFPCESGKINDDFLKNMEHEESVLVDQIIAYDTINKQLVCSQSEIYEFDKINLRIPEVRKVNYLKRQFNKCTSFVPDEIKNELMYITLQNSPENYFLNKFEEYKEYKKNKKTQKDAKTEKYIKYINSISNMQKIIKRISAKKVSKLTLYTNINNNRQYKLNCEYCSHESIISVNCNEIFGCRIECPICHYTYFKSSIFENNYYEYNITKVYFELLPNKDVLVIMGIKRDELIITDAFILTKQGVNLLFKKGNYGISGFFVNSPDEIRQIFENSNLAEYNIPSLFLFDKDTNPKPIFDIEENNCQILGKYSFDIVMNVYIKSSILRSKVYVWGDNCLRELIEILLQNIKNKERIPESFEEIFGFSEDILNYLEKQNGFSIYFAKKIKAIHDIRPETDYIHIYQVLQYICDEERFPNYNSSCKTVKRILEIVPKNISLDDIKEYLDSCTLHQGLCISTALSYYYDYIDISNKLGYNFHIKRILFPNDLKKQHNIASFALNSIQEENYSYKFSEEYCKKYEKYEYKENGITVILSKRPEEIVIEGREQMHCIISYIQRIKEGNSVIFFIRREESPDKPLYAAELIPGTNNITQIKGVGNKNPDEPEVLVFIDKWLKKKGLFWKN